MDNYHKNNGIEEKSKVKTVLEGNSEVDEKKSIGQGSS